MQIQNALRNAALTVTGGLVALACAAPAASTIPTPTAVPSPVTSFMGANGPTDIYRAQGVTAFPSSTFIVKYAGEGGPKVEVDCGVFNEQAIVFNVRENGRPVLDSYFGANYNTFNAGSGYVLDEVLGAARETCAESLAALNREPLNGQVPR